MLRKWWPMAVLTSSILMADDVSLVRQGDSWRLFKGRGEPSVPPEAWRQAGFNDGAWLPARSGFGLDWWAYMPTTISETVRDYVSIYFRRQFTVERPENVAWLVLRVDYAGGFVAYLNGVEIARRGLPGDPGSLVPYNTPADLHYRGQPEEIDVTGFAHLLAAGTNTLAVQWHNSVPGYAGAAFVAELLANFTRGPYLQNTSTNQQTIMWKSAVPCDTVVEFGATPALGERFVDATLTTNHQAALTGLAPDTTYYYRVAGTSGDRTGTTSLATFRTFRSSGPVSFVVTADVGLTFPGQFAVAERMREGNPDLVLLAGDLNYPQWEPKYADLRFFSTYGPHMRRTPFFVAAGNHDVIYGIESDFYASFAMPTNSVDPAVHQAARTEPESYYSFDQGDAHFVALYVPLQQGRFALTNGSPQLLWLEADLAASLKPWKILFLHHPVRTSGPHGGDDANYNGILDPFEVGDLLLPLARRYGVQLIFSGHDHLYERFNPIDGVNLIVTGGGGGFVYSVVKWDPASSQVWSRWHCVNVVIDGDSLRLEAIADVGVIFDTMYLQRAPPPRQVYPATWHSPTLESIPANDSDGNVVGQKFDFLGPPIPTLPGDFSNLGRVYVNHDHSNLYVAFEQPMIHSANNICLFLECPAAPGVPALAGLGNGVVDPEGEGVDGLDFLENLSFTNFTPSVAFVLGDEFADGQYRGFLRTNYVAGSPGGWRTNLALPIGQGAFRLDQGFTDVPGVRIQQFNRSPQTSVFAGEQNANFIEILVPLRELGLRGGDRFKLGAVVCGSGVNTNADQQTRELDRSYLGYSLVGSGQQPCALEGLEVQLGPDQDADGDGLLAADELRWGTDAQKADTDGDGLPDGWEVNAQFNPLSTSGVDGADGDPDGDGYLNREEYAAGTNPRQRNLPLHAGATVLASGRVQIWWYAMPGRKYRLQYADALTNAFADLPGLGWPREATKSLETYDDSEAAGQGLSARFYRVRLVP